jgi:sortase A
MSPGKRKLKMNKDTGLPEPRSSDEISESIESAAPKRGRARKNVRRLGNVLLIAGLLTTVYMAVLLYWGDPYTSWQTSRKQHHLSGQLNNLDKKWANSVTLPGENGNKPVSPATQLAALGPICKSGCAQGTKGAQTTLTGTQLAYAKAARAFAQQMHDTQAIGRIRIGSIGLNMAFVQGTSEHDLTFGPGHYVDTSLPGMHTTVAIAGHRTTYFHPFRHIDAIHEGDYITLDMPYGTFTYRVYFHKIVNSNDWSIISKRPFEKLVLSACHPLYSATHRYVIFAKLVKEQKAVASSFTTAGNHATK